MLGPLRMAVVDDRTDSYVVVDRDDKPLAEYQDPGLACPALCTT